MSDHIEDTGSATARSGPVRRGLRRWVRRTLTTLLALLVVYAVLAVRFYTGRPNIARNFSAEFNESFAAVPESERAWPVYREALLQLPLLAERIDREDLLNTWPDVPVDGPDAGPVLAYLAEASESIVLVHRAAAMPVMGREISDVADTLTWDRLAAAGHAVTHPVEVASPNPPLRQVFLDQLGSLRELTRLLRADVRLAAVQGDGDRAFADLVAILGMADHAESGLGLISRLVGFAIRAMAIDGLAEASGIDADLMTTEQLEELYQRLAGYAGGGRPDLGLDDERKMVLDIAQRLFTDDGAGDGRVCLAGFRNLAEMQDEPLSPGHYVFGPLNALRFGTRREFIAEFDRLTDLFRKDIASPVWMQSAVFESERAVLEIKADPDAGPLRTLASAHVPAFGKAAAAAELIRLERDAALAGLAAELHRRRTGRYPETAAELVERFPNDLPPDWIDGLPLRYAVVDGRAVVYSLGPDGDDDGGRLPEEGRTSKISVRGSPEVSDALKSPEGLWTYDGDLVLWPRWLTEMAVHDER